ncbi:prohibitin family protein [bacterium]|nr:prohibitin family protein [bacterium]
MSVKSSGCLVAIVVAVIFVLVFLNPIVIIPPGYVGVKVLFGKVYPTILRNGLHIVNPLISVKKMDIRLQAYTMSVAPQEGEISGDDAIDVLTSEGLKVKLDLTAWYRLIPEKAPDVYKTIGEDYVYKVIRPLLRTAIRDIAVKYTAEDIYSTKRDEFVDRMMEHATKLAEGKGVEIDRVLLRNVKLPSEIEKAINAKLAADQEAQRMNFVLEKEKLEKERKIIEAEGIREANRIIAQGLTANYLRWYRIEMMKQLINSPNNTIMVIPEDLKSLPMIMPTGK